MDSANSERSALLDALAQLSRLRPEWRLGQTIANVATTAGRMDAGGVWDLEDEEALSAVKILIDDYAEEGLANPGFGAASVASGLAAPQPPAAPTSTMHQS